MEIVKLDKNIYAGKKFKAQYRTNGYYDIRLLMMLLLLNMFLLKN